MKRRVKGGKRRQVWPRNGLTARKALRQRRSSTRRRLIMKIYPQKYTSKLIGLIWIEKSSASSTAFTPALANAMQPPRSTTGTNADVLVWHCSFTVVSVSAAVQRETTSGKLPS